MSKEKNYVGNGRAVNGKYGTIYKISIKVEDLLKLPQTKGWVRLTMSELKQPDKFGNTHTVYENDYTPSEKPTESNENEWNDDLPF